MMHLPHVRRQRPAPILPLADRVQFAYERGLASPAADNPFGRRTSGKALHEAFARGQSEAAPTDPQPVRCSGDAWGCP